MTIKATRLTSTFSLLPGIEKVYHMEALFGLGSHDYYIYAMIREQTAFILANQTLSEVVGKIQEGQWGMKIPSWFKTGRTQVDATLRTIVNYHAYDDAWVPDVLAGKTIQEVGSKYDGDLLGEHPARSFEKINEASCRAVREIKDPEKIVHLSYGDFPAREYLQHILSFRGFRVYDIAKLIGADTTMPPQLVDGMWDIFAPRAEEWRKLGVFGPEIQVPANSSLQRRLLAMTGRAQ